jgi:hypothetical protein
MAAPVRLTVLRVAFTRLLLDVPTSALLAFRSPGSPDPHMLSDLQDARPPGRVPILTGDAQRRAPSCTAAPSNLPVQTPEHEEHR